MPAAAVEIEDALHISLHPRAGKDDTRPKLHLRRENFVAEFLIPLEGDAIDDRIFHDSDDQRIALAAEREVGEAACREQGLQGQIGSASVRARGGTSV